VLLLGICTGVRAHSSSVRPSRHILLPSAEISPYPTGEDWHWAFDTKTSPVTNAEKMRFVEAVRSQALPVKLTYERVFGRVESPFDHSWQQFPQSARTDIVRELAPYFTEKPGLAYLPFNRCSDLHDLGIADAGYRCAEFDRELGIERLRVEIDWAGFTDSQIVAAFKTWVRENRRPGTRRADDRGQRKGKGYGNYLAWLGIMRLMHAYPFTSTAKLSPKAWQLYRGADWPRSRRRAGEIFRDLFPFLPSEDRPIKWSTAGGRGR